MRYAMILALAATTAGCTGAIDAPSLAPRAVERQSIEPPGEPVEIVGEVSPVLTERLATIVATAEQGERAFASERRATETAVAAAAGAAAGSDRWLAAQQALSALETTLGPARDATAALDGLRAEPANAAPAARAAIDAAAARVEAIAATERGTLNSLAARLS